MTLNVRDFASLHVIKKSLIIYKFIQPLNFKNVLIFLWNRSKFPVCSTWREYRRFHNVVTLMATQLKWLCPEMKPRFFCFVLNLKDTMTSTKVLQIFTIQNCWPKKFNNSVFKHRNQAERRVWRSWHNERNSLSTWCKLRLHKVTRIQYFFTSFSY